jgi:hypothetical protein
VRPPTLSRGQSSLPERSTFKIASKQRAHALPVVDPPFGGASEASGDCRTAQPSPPVSQVPGAFPESSGLGSAPSEETASKRPPSRRLHGMRRISKRLVAKQIWPSAIKPTSSFIACRRQKRRCKTESRLQDTKARPRTPPKRVHPAGQAHRSLGPKTASLLLHIPVEPSASRIRRSKRPRRQQRAVAQRRPPAGHFLVTRDQEPSIHRRIRSRPNNKRGGRPSAVACLLSFTLHIVGKGLF